MGIGREEDLDLKAIKGGRRPLDKNGRLIYSDLEDSGKLKVIDHDGNIEPLAGEVTTASNITYDNSNSNFVATDVQNALDEVKLPFYESTFTKFPNDIVGVTVFIDDNGDYGPAGENWWWNTNVGGNPQSGYLIDGSEVIFELANWTTDDVPHPVYVTIKRYNSNGTPNPTGNIATWPRAQMPDSWDGFKAWVHVSTMTLGNSIAREEVIERIDYITSSVYSTYDNTNSNLTATNVQDAIDEVVDLSDVPLISWGQDGIVNTGDGVHYFPLPYDITITKVVGTLSANGNTNLTIALQDVLVDTGAWVVNQAITSGILIGANGLQTVAPLTISNPDVVANHAIRLDVSAADIAASDLVVTIWGRRTA